MKSQIILLIILLAQISLLGQDKDPYRDCKVYGGAGFGYPESSGGYFTVILKNDWGGSLCGRQIRFESWGGMIEISLFLVREFPFKKTKLVRAGLEAGPAWIKLSDYQYASYVGFGWRNEVYISSTTMGLGFRAKLEFPLSQGFGLECAIYGNLNIPKSHIGVEVMFMIGKVRDRIRPKNRRKPE